MTRDHPAKPDEPKREGLSPELELELEFLSGGAQRARESQDPEPAARRVPRILVVDDDPELRTYARRCIEKAFGDAAEVVGASDGVEAFRLARHRGADLFLCEVSLPRMGGLELLAAVRADPELASTPVILTGAQSLSRADRARVAASPGVSLLVKPFNARKLRDAVRRHLA